MSPRELHAALKPLEIEWPRSGFDADRLNLWYGHLRKFTLEQVSGAVSVWIGEGKYFPKIAELRGIIERNTPAPSQPAPPPRQKLDDMEKTWRAVIGRYASCITFHNLPKDVPIESGVLMTDEEIEAFVQTVKVPINDTVEAHRAGLGELRRRFEELWGPLAAEDGRYTHAYCGCSQCEHEVRQSAMRRMSN